MTKKYTIELPYEVAHFYELQAAKDDQRLEDALPVFLEAAMLKSKGRDYSHLTEGR